VGRRFDVMGISPVQLGEASKARAISSAKANPSPCLEFANPRI
jgi:hypothetical protein